MSDDEHDFTLPSIRKKRNVKSTKIDDKEEEAYKFMKKATQVKKMSLLFMDN